MASRVRGKGEGDSRPMSARESGLRARARAYYSWLPLTGNYAEWELSLSKWASIVRRDHPHGYACHIHPIRR